MLGGEKVRAGQEQAALVGWIWPGAPPLHHQLSFFMLTQV